MMHPSRRRKKQRPSYGIRTVEVVRGPNGFGFTISGQQPCILSCIVSGSPAEQAGLRAGDFLISVNGMSVSKSTHDSVVNLIGHSVGPIKMTIAENYYSDSSDEEMAAAASRKPKYVHRPRMRMHRHHHNRYDAHAAHKAEKANLNSPLKKAMRMRDSLHPVQQQQSAPAAKAGQREEAAAAAVEYKALVGYLGTIEMPKQVLPSARLQTVCSCIRKLRQEKRPPTAVLIIILPTCVMLKSASNQILAIYPTARVIYISSSTDKESRYFGLVTSAVCDNSDRAEGDGDGRGGVEISNSCHIFAVDSKIVEHDAHRHRADHFGIACTADATTGMCQQFPSNSLHIVSLVQNMYKLQVFNT